ncbi:MAG: BON domain-containing protein [Specibacter sp.]
MTTDTLSDRHIQMAVESELRWTPDVEAPHIGVSVDNHAVTLTGTVGSFPERMAARRAALRVKGVSAVADDLTVHYAGAPLTDTDIAESVGLLLDASAVIPQGAVQASVRDHLVTLTGSVPWNYQRTEAARAVGGVKGVTHVENHITLSQPSAVVLSSKIKDALARNAALEAQQINVDVKGDVVTLSGHLSSWSEKKQAGLTAWAAPGVGFVHNNIDVDPD